MRVRRRLSRRRADRRDQFLEIGVGIVAQNRKHRQVVANDLARRHHLVGSRAIQHHAQKGFHLLGRDGIGDPLLLREQNGQTADQRQQFDVGEPTQTDHRSREVLVPRLGKPPVLQTRTERLVTEKSAPRVFKELRRSAEHDPEGSGASLQRIVEDREQFFVVRFARDAVGDLIEVDAFVDEDDQPSIPDLAGKDRPEFQVIVPVLVVDDRADPEPERRARLGLPRKLAAQPAQARRATLGVIFRRGAEILCKHAGEIKSADVPFEFVKHLADRRNHARNETGILGGKILSEQFRLQGRVVARQNDRERPALGRRLGREVLHQFAVGRETRVVPARQAAFGGQIGVRGEESSIGRVSADQLDQETLAAPVSADQKTDGGSPLGDLVKIAEQRTDLFLSSDRDIRRSTPRYDARGKRRQKSIQDPLRHLHLCSVHFATSST